MEHGGSMLHSQGVSNNSYPKPNQSNSLWMATVLSWKEISRALHPSQKQPTDKKTDTKGESINYVTHYGGRKGWTKCDKEGRDPKFCDITFQK